MHMRKRCVILFIVLNLLFFCSFLSVIKVATEFSYFSSATQNSLLLEVDRCRGTIYDCSLSPITNSTYEYIAAVPPYSLSRFKGYNISRESLERLKSGYPALVTVDRDFSYPTINIFKVPVYNKYQLCNHLVGYLGSNGQGASGIEKAYDEVLSGGRLSVRFPRDAKGQILKDEKSVIVNDNYNFKKGIALTIDKKIQRIANFAAKKYINRGAVVVLDVKSGEIKGMVSTPDIDINNLEISLEDESAPFLNRAISPFSVGSVFKLCIGAAALQKGINIDYNCVGRVKVGDRYFHCQDQKAHGEINLSSALSLSCNCYFITLGQRVGAENIYEMMRDFGFGAPKRFAKGMVSDSGTVPNLNDILNNPSSLANLCIGQGVLTASPLQIASMVQCIANDGALINPNLVLGEVTKRGKLIKKSPTAPTHILNKGVCAYLKSAMIQTVESGTGKGAKPELGGAGGKTATAETSTSNTTWFAGFFPAQNPRYVVTVMAENGVSGGKSAAPVFKFIADKLK